MSQQPRRTRWRVDRRTVTATLMASALALVACSGDGSAVALVDGGTAEVSLLGDVIVTTAPGAVVTIEHGSEPTADAEEAPVTHAFVVPGDGLALPPVFVRRGDGLAPNPGVYGACRGGPPAKASNGCPIPPIEGPDAWDGTAYWSTGAMLPAESRELPLSEDIAPGDHHLVCALHPGLRVVIRVDAAAPEPSERDVAAEVDAALAFAAEADPHRGPNQVTAGVTAGNAFVAAFSPETVRIPVGGTVTWRAGARTPVDVVFGASEEELSLSHTQPSDALPSRNADAWNGEGVLQSGFLSADPAAGAAAATWTATFRRPGTYRYASRFSPTLQGTVIVE
jgi:plastocyanin